MKPMTKEEWDARQSVIRRVVDPETGRTRFGPGGGGRRGVRMPCRGSVCAEPPLLYPAWGNHSNRPHAASCALHPKMRSQAASLCSKECCCSVTSAFSAQSPLQLVFFGLVILSCSPPSLHIGEVIRGKSGSAVWGLLLEYLTQVGRPRVQRQPIPRERRVRRINGQPSFLWETSQSGASFVRHGLPWVCHLLGASHMGRASPFMS